MTQIQNKINSIYVIGIGEEGLTALPEKTRKLVQNARHIFGGVRHLEMVKHLTATLHPWPKPFIDAIDDLKRLKDEGLVVLASGDPMYFGVGATLQRYFAKDELEVIPYISSLSYAAAKMGWPLQDVRCLSVHGRPIESLTPHIKPSARLLILANDRDTPKNICQILEAIGSSQSEVTVLENLGGDSERISTFNAHALPSIVFSDLNVVAIECRRESNYVQYSRFLCLPDDAFLHDGQLTKQDIRSVTMAHLAPRDHEVLWDVGAGCGSISIEWLRAGHSMVAVAFERDAQRASLIKKNTLNLGLTNLKLVVGNFPDVFDRFENENDIERSPDAIFIGGGLTTKRTLETCWSSLNKGGRLVANVVTLEAETKLLKFAQKNGGRLIKINIAEQGALGRYKVWRPALPVTMMICHKLSC